MSFRQTILTLSLFGIAAGSSAQGRYDGWIAKTVSTHHCNLEQTQVIDMALSEGLENIARLNPELVQNRINFTKSRTAVFDCDTDLKMNAAAGAETEVKKNGASIFGVKITKDPYLSQALIKIGHVFSGNRTGTSNESTILHEFLHFLSFDNLPTPIHNDAHFLQTPRTAMLNMTDAIATTGYTLDVVYSCSIAAFANTERTSKLVTMFGLRVEDFINTCEAAKPHKYKIIVHTSELKYLYPQNQANRGDASLGCLIVKGGKDTPYAKWDASLWRRCEIR